MGTREMVAVEAEAAREIPRSARRKTDALMRLLRGEDLDQLSRSSGRRPTGWRLGGTTSWPGGWGA